MSIMGGVFTDKFIVQRLTDMKWLAISSTEEDKRVYCNARVFLALRKCINKLQTYYENLDQIPPLVPNQPHSRYFPYPTSFFTDDGTTTRFRYLSSLEQDATCVTYLAEIISDTTTRNSSVQVVVKFVTKYGQEVHKLLANSGHAPSLLYYGPIPDTKLSCFPVQGAHPGLSLSADTMHMVVMDHIVTQSRRPSNARVQLETILYLLHSNGYVFGDLRMQNILFSTDNKVMLIDFNWCGRYNPSIRDEWLPGELQAQIDNNINLNKDMAGAVAYYPLAMSTLPGMWASGMEPLAQIRPHHDWMMLEKLLW